MAFVERRGKKWRARYRAPDGREHSRTFTRKADAEDFLTKVRTRLLAGEWVDPKAGRTTLAAFEEEWRRTSTLAQSSLALHDAVWRRWVRPALGDFPLRAITRAGAQQLVDDVYRESGSAWTAQSAHRVLRKLLQEAVDGELIVRNTVLRLKLPKPERARFQVLTPEQIRRLVETVPQDWRAFVLLKTYGALRFSEAAGLRVDRVDWERRHVRIDQVVVEASGRLHIRPPKTESGNRTVAVPAFVMDALRAHVDSRPPGEGGLVFHDRNGNPIRRSTFYRMWRTATAEAGIPGFKVRNLRHTGASLAIAAGTEAIHLSKRLGHTSSAFTARVYGQIYEAKDREIADRLENLAAWARPGGTETEAEAEGKGR
jgi:integrase